MFNDNIMYCPICETRLKIDGSFKYEDICESVCYSEKYVCDNDECILCKRKSYWNDSGDFWSGDMKWGRIKEVFTHDLTSPFNSFSRKSDIEIYKKGLKKKTYLSPWLTLKWLQPYIEYDYKGDYYGNVLSRSWKLKFLKKDDDRNEYCIHYSSSISSFVFVIKHFLSKRKHLNKEMTPYGTKSILEEFEKLPDWDKRCYRLISKYIILKLFRRTYKKATKINTLYNYISYGEIKTIAEKYNYKITNIIKFLSNKTEEEISIFKTKKQ